MGKKKKLGVVIGILSLVVVLGVGFFIYRYLHPHFDIPASFTGSYQPLFPVREGFTVRNITVSDQTDLLLYEATKDEYTIAVTQQNKPENFQFESLKQENVYLSDNGKAVVVNDDVRNTTTLSLEGDNVWLIARSTNKVVPNKIIYDFIDSLQPVKP